MVGIGVGPGASGSAVVDAQTGEIVGLVEAVFPGTQMPTVVIPTGQSLYNFIEDDSTGLKPDKEPPVKDEDHKNESVWIRIVRFIIHTLNPFLS